MKKRIIGAVLVSVLLLTAAKSPAISNDNIEITQYKGLKFTWTEKEEITDKRVDEEVQSILDANRSQQEITGRSAQAGDWVNIDFTGLIDGVAFEGGTGAGYNLELGSGAFIPGFEEQIEGHGAGEQFEFDLAFPDPYQPDPSKAGVTAHWIVTVNRIFSLTTPELNDEFVQNIIGMDGVTTPDEYRNYVREQLEAQAENNADEANDQAIFDALEANTTVKKYPQDQIDAEVAKSRAVYEANASAGGVSLEDYVTGTMGMTMEAFENQLTKVAEDGIRQHMIIDAIAEKEDLTVSDEDYTKDLDDFAGRLGFSGGEEMKSLYSEEDIRYAMEQDKVFQFLRDNADVQKPAGEKDKAASSHKMPFWGWILIAAAVLLAAVIFLRDRNAKIRRKRRKKSR